MQQQPTPASPYQLAFLFAEMLIMAAGTVLAVYLRLGGTAELFTQRYAWYRITVVPVVLQVAFYYFDLHNFRVSRPFLWDAARIAQAMAIGTLGLSVVYYIFPSLFLGRGVLFGEFLVVTGLVIGWRQVYGWALKQRLFSTKVLLVGSGSLADAILDELVSRSDNVYSVVCLVDVKTNRGGESRGPNLLAAWANVLRAPLRTEDEELLGLVKHYQADLIVVAMEEKRGLMPLKQLLSCRMAGVPVVGGEDFLESIAGRIMADHISDSWLVFSPGFSSSGLRRTSKRVVDLFLSALGLVLASPLMALTALAVRLDSKGPIFYKQQRVGQFGGAFNIYKFRSMTVDAEAASGPVWAQQNDPRVTRVGKFIRKTRLDEIPQMYNVLRGDMSFVGPRPERPHFVARLQEVLPYYRERHNVKPGITGWAQVCFPYGASEAAALEKLNLDLYYIKHHSLSMDFMIILQTARMMLFGGGGR